MSIYEGRIPIRTTVGVKHVPTQRVSSRLECSKCRWNEPCYRDVERGDFAWCEDALNSEILKEMSK